MLKTKIVILVFGLINCALADAQSYAPAAGFRGSTAIHKDSSIFRSWANKAEVRRGRTDIAQADSPLADWGEIDFACGKPQGTSHVVSLGDGGSITLSFEKPIADGEGPDFAIFENGFRPDSAEHGAFLELAFVEVSSDGSHFVRFPGISEIPSDTQRSSFDKIDARYIRNFAGKYTAGYGTPFDLNELRKHPELGDINLQSITHVRVTDVCGCILPEFARFDSKGNIVNDPYPTAFSSGGFDFNALGVINTADNIKEEVSVFPNPATNKFYISAKEKIVKTELYNVFGIKFAQFNNTIKVDISEFKPGIYFLKIKDAGNRCYTKKLLIKR